MFQKAAGNVIRLSEQVFKIIVISNGDSVSKIPNFPLPEGQPQEEKN